MACWFAAFAVIQAHTIRMWSCSALPRYGRNGFRLPTPLPGFDSGVAAQPRLGADGRKLTCDSLAALQLGRGSMRPLIGRTNGTVVKRIFVPTRTGSDWQRLLAKPTLHWKKGKSAMTAAVSWERASDNFPPEIAALLNSSHDEDLVDLKLLVAIPEWEVPLEGGKTASHTDILALARNDRGLCVVGVEAKVDEDFGPLVKDKRAEVSTGQHDRLVYLQSLLGLVKLDDGIRYQLLHRTASAILTAREFHAHVAVMTVQSFGKRTSLREDFDAYCRALGAEDLPGGMRVVRSFRQPRLFLGWCNGDPRFLEGELPSAV